MENQHRKIPGYRELTKEEIDLMNRIKAQGIELQALVRDIDKHLQDQAFDALAMQHNPEDPYDGEQEVLRISKAEPHRWKAKGTTSLQEGLMFLTRAVAQPTTF